MPRMDGTGPWGMGPCGWGWRAGPGWGWRTAPGWGWRVAPSWGPWRYSAGFSREELLREQKKTLEEQLAWIEEELKAVESEEDKE